MRRRLSIATFALLLAAMPVAAQHGGGHAVGGHAGSFSGRAGFSGVHVSGGMRTSQGAPRGFTHSPSFSQRGSTNRHFPNGGSHGRHVRTYGFRNNCYGHGCQGSYFYPYAYSGFYDPYWWWDSDSSGYHNYDEAYERNRSIANEMNQQSLEEQRMRRQEEADGDQDVYARPGPPARPDPGDEPQPTEVVPATLLIFRDQHKQEIRNYAIVGQTLWNFASPRTEKIPLADLDLAATTKVNDDRGLTFHVPSPNEAQ